MKIRFWGVRGGLPSPGRNTIELGGNTPCTEIKLNDEHSILIDSGTGIIEYASKGVDPKKTRSFTFLSVIFIGTIYKAFRSSFLSIERA